MNYNISEIKKCITFIYIKDENGERKPNGTGFLVSVNVESRPDSYVIYLVSAKHVLQYNQKFYDEIAIRLNRRETNDSEFIDIPTGMIPIFTHAEPDVDLVVIPITSFFRKDFPKIYDFKHIPQEMVTTKEIIETLKIAEGDEIFFCGLFVSHPGQERNQPIARFGKVSLLSDERVEYIPDKNLPSKFLDLYLMECLSFGGNSGSPVFFYLPPLRDLRRINYLDPRIYFAGVISGSFDVTEIQASLNIILSQNVGIAAVIPSFKLHDILFSTQVRSNRNSATEFARYH